MPSLPRTAATRYVQPLREGGSLPAVVDTDDGLYVVKFRGAGQGPKALIAEIVVARLAETLDLATPKLALVEIADAFGRSEPDPEIQDILRRSVGINVGLRYLDGAFNFAVAAAGDLVTPDWASRVVWLDAFLTNPDRTHRNTNLLVWERRPWLIDHGAALYAHHDWARIDDARTRAAFPLIKDHVLLGMADDLAGADARATEALTEEALGDALAAVPDELLADPVIAGEFDGPDAARDRYLRYLTDRLRGPRAFVDEAIRARGALLATAGRRLEARR